MKQSITEYWEILENLSEPEKEDYFKPVRVDDF